MAELKQKLNTQLLRCDLDMDKGCYGKDNPDGECPLIDDPYNCRVPAFIRTCLDIPHPGDKSGGM